MSSEHTQETATDEGQGKKLISRRGFLIATGVGGAGVLMGVTFGVPYARLKLADVLEDAAGAPIRLEAEATAWFQIKPDNTIILYIPKIELGQGVHTALAQVAAEELEIAWEQLEVVHARTGQGLDDPAGTQASSSVSSLYQPLREAAATLREMLRSQAARQLGVAASSLTATAGAFTFGSGEALTYGEIAAHIDEATWQIPETPPALKATRDFEKIGQSLGRVDLLDKIVGVSQFGYDVRLPDMAYGAVARPSVIGETMVSASAGDAESMPGVIAVVIENGFAGVVAETREQAYAALDALDVQWSGGVGWQQADVEAAIIVGEGKGITIQKVGNPERIFRGRQPLIGEYRTPIGIHAQMEPQAATADVQLDQVQIWTSTQAAMIVRDRIADYLEREPESIVITPTYVGGGFGRKIDSTTALDAVRLSAAVERPVHIGWSRSEEFLNGFVRPPTHHVLTGLVDEAGRIEAMQHDQASGEVAFPFLPQFLKVVMGADFAAWRGAFIQYGIPHKHTEAWLNDLPFATGWWRGLGLMANTFAVESFMDELAYEANVDPLQFRLNHLPDDEHRERFQRVLETLREKSNWGSGLAEGQGRGVAICLDVGTIVAQIVEVSIVDNDIQVDRVTAVVDPGLVINPDGAEAQTQGGIMMGLSATLLEEGLIEDGQFMARNYDKYPLLRFGQTPLIEVTLLESGDEPHGMGEPPIGPIAAATANAVFAATGQRLRRLPLRLR